VVPLVGFVGTTIGVSTYWVRKRRRTQPTSTVPLQRLTWRQQELKTSTLPLQPTANVKIPKNREVLLFNSFADTLDHLFDLLTGLQGHVNWSKVNSALESCKLAKVVGANEAVANLNYRSLSKFVLTQQPKDAAIECKSILNQLQANAESLGSANKVIGTQESYNTLKSAVFAYFLLNDVLLGQTLGDPAVSKEKSELLNTLGNLRKTGTDFAEFLGKLKKPKELSVEDTRLLLRQQIGAILKN
jgi:hypothetical protein